MLGKANKRTFLEGCEDESERSGDRKGLRDHGDRHRGGRGDGRVPLLSGLLHRRDDHGGRPQEESGGIHQGCPLQHRSRAGGGNPYLSGTIPVIRRT